MVQSSARAAGIVPKVAKSLPLRGNLHTFADHCMLEGHT